MANTADRYNVDLIIKNGLVLEGNGQGQIIDNGFVAVKNGLIEQVGQGGQADRFNAAKTISADNGIIMPGLINSHTHAAMTLFRGLADDLPLIEWLEQHIFPAEAKLNAELIETGTELACAEMISSGVTTLCDMYLWEDTVAQVIDRTGLRGFVGEVLYDFPSPHYGDLDSGFEFTRDFIAQYKGHDRIEVMVMPHALYTCSPDLLTRAWDLAAQTGADVHTHLAESPGEEFLVNESYKKRPAGHLNGLGLLTDNLLAAHGVHFNDQEIQWLAEKGVRVAHCPESNMKLASGVAKLGQMDRAGITIGLGTDGAAANNDLSILGEMRSCALIHKAITMDPTAADAESVLNLATTGGAAALGRADSLGRLARGYIADIIVIDTSRPHMNPLYNPASHLVYAALPTDVVHTVVQGRVLMENRVLTTIDMDRLKARVGEAAVKIKN